MNMIRNWVGQSTSPDLYEFADKYGILLWDEFFQPNPSDGPNPTEFSPPTWPTSAIKSCAIATTRRLQSGARGTRLSAPEIESALRTIMAELEPTRLYQSSSTEGRGVKSNGPYFWRTPRQFYVYNNNEAFKTRDRQRLHPHT